MILNCQSNKGYVFKYKTCLKKRVTEKVLAGNVDINSSEEFSQVVQEVCSSINVLFVSEKEIKSQIPKLDKMWHPKGIEIERIPNIGDAHVFGSIKPYEFRCSMHSLVNN